MSTPPCIHQSQAIDNVPVLQTPADIAGAVNFESVNPNDGFVQVKAKPQKKGKKVQIQQASISEQM